DAIPAPAAPPSLCGPETPPPAAPGLRPPPLLPAARLPGRRFASPSALPRKGFDSATAPDRCPPAPPPGPSAGDELLPVLIPPRPAAAGPRPPPPRPAPTRYGPSPPGFPAPAALFPKKSETASRRLSPRLPGGCRRGLRGRFLIHTGNAQQPGSGLLEHGPVLH